MSPSTVTPVRLTALSGTGASHTGLRVSRSIAATWESNEPGPDGDGEGPAELALAEGVALDPGGESPNPSV